MTPIHKFRPRWIDRCLYRRKYTIQAVALAIVSLLALYGLWYSVTETREAQFRVEEERRKTMLAERTTQELFDVLKSKIVMLECDPSAKYGMQAKVKWELVKMEEAK